MGDYVSCRVGVGMIVINGRKEPMSFVYLNGVLNEFHSQNKVVAWRQNPHTRSIIVVGVKMSPSPQQRNGVVLVGITDFGNGFGENK